MIGLFIGRFQPVHNGHIFALKQILKECDQAICVIGSAGKAYSEKNPYTSGERIAMLDLALKEEGLSDKCVIVQVNDTDGCKHSLWTAKIRNNSPDFDVVYSNNPLVKELFAKEGMQVKELELIARNELTGTEIRKKIASGAGWEKLVPPSVADYIKSKKLDEKLKRITSFS